IFQRLRALANESRWVGDPHQAIFGFRGTDPGLVHRVWEATPRESRVPLKMNRRSQAGLVQLVGRLFRPELGDGVVQTAHRPAAGAGIERWIFAAQKKEEDQRSLAAGVGLLRAGGTALRDIAILVRRNDEGEKIGQALQGAGIPALMELPGLFSTREG